MVLCEEDMSIKNNTTATTSPPPSSEWANLPKDLLQMIANCLDSPVDVLRFRGVCSSWLSSVPSPSFDQESPPLLIKLPRPFNSHALLFHSTLCFLQFLRPHRISSYSSKAKLTKVTESSRGKLQFLHPLTNFPIRYPQSHSGLNLLDLRFVHLCRASMLKSSSPAGVSFSSSIYGINKVVSFPVSTSAHNHLSILAIFHEGKLGYCKNGDEDWTLLDDNNFQYDDIIERKGQFYVVDRWGTVSWIDSSLKLIQYSPPLYGCGGQKNLVESNGDLYVVDRYLDGERRKWVEEDDLDVVVAAAAGDNINMPLRRRSRRFKKCNPKAVDFRVYKLDEEWGTWIDVNSLNDQIFVLGIDCSFSVSAGDLVGGKGNCIYFTDDDNYYSRSGLSNDSVRVYQLEDRSIENLSLLPHHSAIFLPPHISLA